LFVQGEEKGKGTDNLFNKIIAECTECFLDHGKDTDILVQKLKGPLLDSTKKDSL
jgi:hypothetical protein